MNSQARIYGCRGWESTTLPKIKILKKEPRKRKNTRSKLTNVDLELQVGWELTNLLEI